MYLKDFLNFYRKTIAGKTTFVQFQAAYLTFDPDTLYRDLSGASAEKLKTMTRQHGTTANMADAVLGKALHFWALSFHVMYLPELETMRDKVDQTHKELTEEKFKSYVKSKQGALVRSEMQES